MSKTPGERERRIDGRSEPAATSRRLRDDVRTRAGDRARPSAASVAASRLKDDVQTRAEDRPGVYRWLAGDGRVLYVGKSVRVRSRLLSYFREADGKTGRLVREAAELAWEYLPNEFAALFREMRLIQAWRPEYNVEHKRRRRLGFVKVTREPAPRLLVVGRATNDGARYYGPLGRAGWLADTVNDLARATGLRDCAGDVPARFGDQAELFAPDRPPLCLRGGTGSCLAPCAGLCTRAEYQRRLAVAQAFLEGRDESLLTTLANALAEAAERLDYEHAARIRDRIKRLERLRAHLSGFRGQAREMNLVYPVPGFRGDDRVYLIRRGRLHGDMPLPKTAGDARRAAQVVEGVFRPALGDRDASMGAVAAADMLLAAKWFARRPSERRKAVAPAAWLAEQRARWDPTLSQT